MVGALDHPMAEPKESLTADLMASLLAAHWAAQKAVTTAL
jgi:hypothetical protein